MLRVATGVQFAAANAPVAKGYERRPPCGQPLAPPGISPETSPGNTPQKEITETPAGRPASGQVALETGYDHPTYFGSPTFPEH